MVRAVGAMCPCLTEVTFCVVSYESDLDAIHARHIVLESIASPETIKSILSGWPKVRSFMFYVVKKWFHLFIIKYFVF